MAYLNPNDITTKDELLNLIERWAKTTFGQDFAFRYQQQKTILGIIWGWLKSNREDIILEAPTGSGKSYIAMIVAGVLSDYFGKTGYILISDLSLLQQYANDVEVYLPSWGVIRGQQTYNCIVNGFPFTSGSCRLQGVKSYSDIMTSFPQCAPYCEYLLAREKAICANVTICTYTHFLMHQNFVKAKMGDSCPFKERDFVICDEAHKLTDIVQNHFSPKFTKKDEEKILLVLDNIRGSYNLQNPSSAKLKISELRRNIYIEENNDELAELLYEYEKLLYDISECTDTVRKSISSTKHISQKDKQLIAACDFVDEHHIKFRDYTHIIKKTGASSMVKCGPELDNYKQIKFDSQIEFKCLHESYLMRNTFHQHTGKKLYMSATIGNPDGFCKEVAIPPASQRYTVFFQLPYTFDYTKSPIYYVDGYLMSKKYYEDSFPKVAEMVTNILKRYKDFRGIIQTGSYAFARKLESLMTGEEKDRLLVYSDSANKSEMLEDFKYANNKVLVGPSLVEGISLNDDLCRFQIVLKVAYPSLGDKFVLKKKDMDNAWYLNTTLISLLQGVGRGVRSKDDWCHTYILDGCFTSLYYSCIYNIPIEFSARLYKLDSRYLLSNP